MSNGEEPGMRISIARDGAADVIITLDDNCDLEISGRDASVTFKTPDGPVNVDRDGAGLVVVFGRSVVWRSPSLLKEERAAQAALDEIPHPTRRQVEAALATLGWMPNPANTTISGAWYLGSGEQWIIMDCYLDAAAVGKGNGGLMDPEAFRSLILRAGKKENNRP